MSDLIFLVDIITKEIQQVNLEHDKILLIHSMFNVLLLKKYRI